MIEINKQILEWFIGVKEINDIIIKEMKFILLVCVLVLKTSQLNYQERAIYYSESDNACSARFDNILLFVAINRVEIIR